MIETVKLSSKGQLVLPRRLREAVGAEQGDIFTIAQENGCIILRKAQLPSKEQIARDLAAFREMRRKAPKLTDAQIQQVIDDVRREIREGRA